MKLQEYAERLVRTKQLIGEPFAWMCAQCHLVVLVGVQKDTWYAMCPCCDRLQEVTRRA